MAFAANRVEVDLQIGNDSLTPALNRIRGLASDMRSSFGQFRDSFVGGAAFGAAQLAIDGVTSSIRNMTGAIQDASRIQTETIANSSDVALGLKIGIEPAMKLVEDTQIKMSRIAASVGSEVEDLNAIFRQVASAIAPISKDPLDFQTKALNISKKMGVLATMSGASPDQSGAVADRFISGGSSFGELAINDIIQKNSVFKNALLQGMKDRGFDQKDLKQQTDQIRGAIWEEALNKAVPDSLIKELQGTAQTVIAGIKNKLFNSQDGLFGFLRKIPEMGNRSALDGFAGMLQSVMSLGETIGSKINFDPMKNLIMLFDWVADLSSKINLIASGTIPFDVRDFYKGLSDFMGSLIDRVSNFIDSVDTDKIGEAVGALIVTLVGAIANNIPKLVGIALKSTYKILVGIASGFFSAIGTAFTLLVKDIQTGIMKIVDPIMAFINPILTPIRMLFNAIKRVFDMANNLIPNVPTGIQQNVGTVAKVGGEILKATSPIFGVIDAIVPKPKTDGQTLPQSPNGSGTVPLAQPQGNAGEGQKQSSNNVFAPVINVAEGSSDPRQMASILMQEINREYRNFTQGVLA